MASSGLVVVRIQNSETLQTLCTTKILTAERRQFSVAFPAQNSKSHKEFQKQPNLQKTEKIPKVGAGVCVTMRVIPRVRSPQIMTLVFR